MKLMTTHVHKCMVKICDMLKIDNEAAVCLEKAVFWKQINPILHIMNGFKITSDGMHRYFPALCFYCYDRGRKKCMHSLLCFDWDFDCHGVIQVNGIFHIPEEPLFIQWL